MGAKRNATAAVRKMAVAIVATLLMVVAMAPAGADAAKINNPSPPNFRVEVTGGFLQFIGTNGTPLQLPLNFAELEPPLPNPSLVGTISVNGQRNGVMNFPAAGITFPPITVELEGSPVTIRLLPVSDATGFIDPLSGRVDLNVNIRIKVEGFVLGQSLGGNCYIGSAGSPVSLGTATHNGAFPSTAGGVYVADFRSDGGAFAGGWLAAEPYSDEASSWALDPKQVPGKPIGTLPKPLPSEIPYNELTDFIPRVAGTWRGANETLRAPAASGCGTGILAGTINGQVNTQIGLPSNVGDSTATLDFKFAPIPAVRVGDNAIVQKAVKSIFKAPGVSADPWLATQTPTAVSAQSVSIDASGSRFTAGQHPTERYAFDLGTGSFGAWTTNPVASFNAPVINEGSPAILLPIRVKVKDADSDEDITNRRIRVVPATDIAIDTTVSSVAGANFRAGSSAHVEYDVTNNSDDDASSQPITFTANLPTGVTLTNLDSPNSWSCNTTSSSATCTLPQSGLAANATNSFDLTVDVDTSTPDPALVQGSAIMPGDPAAGNNSDNVSVDVVKTDLAVNLTRTSPLVANGWTPYTVDVSNAGDGLTVGDTTVDVALPPDFSYRSIGSGGSGWSCTTPVDNRNVSCVRSATIAGNASAPQITIVANIDRNAAAIPSTVTATVATQADVNVFGGADSDDDTSTVAILPDLAADTSISGDFIVGDPGTVTYSATNESVVPINGPTTISSTLPAGLLVTAVSGPGWDCSATTLGTSDISCSFAAGLGALDSTSNLNATVAVSQAAYPGVTVSSTLANAEDGFALNDSDAADVTVRRLDVAIQKLAVKPFNVGIEGRYRLNVTNTGDAATVGATTVIDDLPAGLVLSGVSGAGWNCGASLIGQRRVECVHNSLLGPGVQAAPIEVRVAVLDAAAQAGVVTNTAYVDTTRDNRSVPADAAITANNTSTVDTTAVAVDLSIDSTHPGDFRVMTEDVYSLTVRNVGFFGTDPGEPIVITDDLPTGILPLIADIDSNRPTWDLTCGEDAGDVTCTIEAPSALDSAMEPESSITIDIPVFITDAAADASNNVAEVSTARDSNPTLSPNNISTDPTSVKRIDLDLDAGMTIPSRAGGIGEISVGLDNIGSAATSAPSVVTIPLATGTSYRPTGSTVTGWSCSSPGAGTQVTCTRSPIIGAGGTAPPLKVRTNVGLTAPDTWNTNVAVSTTGEAPQRLANNAVTVAQQLEKVDLTIVKSHDPAAVKAGTRSSYAIVVQNVGNTASSGTIRVDETVNSTFTDVAAGGPGWSCSVIGNNVACTRTASLPAAGTTPVITVGFNIPSDAAGTRDATATVSHSGDPYSANNTTNGPIQIVASADVRVSIDQPATMKVGDPVNVTYTVENIGTEDTSGSPSVKLKIGTSSGLDPVGTSSPDGWDCSITPAADPEPASLDCDLPDPLAPGASSQVVAEYDVIPTDDIQTATLALVTTSGDINPSNNVDTATSDLSGTDLHTSVAVPPGGDADLTAGETSRRVVTVENVGTAPTSAPISVRVPLPDGVQWDSAASGAGGSGWTCSQQVRDVVCDRSDQLGVGGSAPALNIDLRPNRSNAPSVTVNYTSSTTGDENAGNDTASRFDNVLYYPDTTITSAPNGTVQSSTANIEFESDDETATFECKVDTGAFAPCTSPLSLSSLSIGEHTVTVRAVNSSAMVDPTPAATSWSVKGADFTGPFKNMKATLTAGSLSLAALGEVPLPADQITLTGKRYTDSGGWSVPADGVDFAPIEQVVDAPGLGSVTVKISITPTGDGAGLLTNGGGPASFTLPVQAKLEASLGSVPVIGPEADCFLRPILFDLAGTYDEAGKTVVVSSSGVSFPTVSAGCGPLGGTVNGLLELPRSDIALSLTFGLEDTGGPVLNGPKLASAKINGKKKVKSGKTVTIRYSVANTGDEAATNVKTCITLKKAKKLAKGKAKRCKTISSVAVGKRGVATFKVKTKKIKSKKAKLNFSITSAYTAQGAARKHTKTGHVTLLR